MAIKIFEADENVHEQLDEDETLWHSHQTPYESIAVTRLGNPEDDDDYVVKPMKCPLCDAEVDYPTCKECGEAFATEEARNGHMSSHSEE
jgi:hypothetical protein